MPRLSLELNLAVGGIVLTIVLVVLDKAGKLRGGLLLWLLLAAALMTVPLALGNPFVASSSPTWKWWTRGMMLALVGFFYWGIAIWISSAPGTEAVNPVATAAPGTEPTKPQTNKPEVLAPRHDTTYDVLKPAREPDPILRVSQEAAEEFIKSAHIPPEVAAELMKTLVGDIEITKRVPKGALKVYLGSNLGYTTKESQGVIRIAQEDLLTIHRLHNGISVDAKIFGDDNRLIVEIENNKPHLDPQHKDYWRSERPDAHTLIIHDKFGHKVLSIRYLNPLAMRLLGVFRHSGKELVVLEDKIMLNGRQLALGNVFGDSGGTLFNIQ